MNWIAWTAIVLGLVVSHGIVHLLTRRRCVRMLNSFGQQYIRDTIVPISEKNYKTIMFLVNTMSASVDDVRAQNVVLHGRVRLQRRRLKIILAAARRYKQKATQRDALHAMELLSSFIDKTKQR